MTITYREERIHERKKVEEDTHNIGPVVLYATRCLLVACPVAL